MLLRSRFPLLLLATASLSFAQEPAAAPAAPPAPEAPKPAEPAAPAPIAEAPKPVEPAPKPPEPPVAPVPAPAPAVVLAPPVPEAAPEIKPVPERIALKDGDKWTFLGDSITHQCLYTQFVEDYVYTRYPKARVHFHNAGVGGDRAKDALDRFDGDVVPQKPTYTTILLGMNDGTYQPFTQGVFDTYQKDMTTLLDKLGELGTAIIPMTPTMFDSRADMARKNASVIKETYYNGVLSLYGSWLREVSYRRALNFVDMWSPLNNLSIEQRRKDAKWTMIPDAVHPSAAGHVVMAAAVIEDVLEKSIVSQVTISQKNGQLASKTTRGSVSNLQKTKKGLSFDFNADSLPWVVPPEAEEGYRLSRAGKRVSEENFAVRDLAAGKYDLLIDGQLVGTWSAGDLAEGFELQSNSKTPQYQQALKVALLNKERNEKAIRLLRNEWAQLKGKRRALAKLQTENSPDLDAQRKAFDEQMPAFQARVDELLAKGREMEDEIYKINQPVPHKYELVATK